MIRDFSKIYIKSIRTPSTVLIAILAGCVLFWGTILIQVLPLVRTIRGEGYGIWNSVCDLFSLGIHGYQFVGLTQYVLLIISALVFVADLILFFELLRVRGKKASVVYQWSGGGLWTAILAFIGYGCAACGSAFSYSLFSLFGLQFIIGVLPLKGLEFSILAIIVGLYSFIVLPREIMKEAVRVVEKK